MMSDVSVSLNKTAGASDIAGGMASPGDFLALLKPRVMSLVIFTALVGLVRAPDHVHPVIAFTALLCIAVGAGAAGALNMWWDADIDAVMTRTTSAEKIEDIERQGGRCHFVDDSGQVYAEAAALAQRIGGVYVDQFTNAERVTDWRGNNNIAESIFQQMQGEPHSVPHWIVVGAGTGGTSATIGRYLRYRH
ncbi:MAG: hypothetical protein B7Y75_04195, partial [Azorhizobium sp. 35-67-5]